MTIENRYTKSTFETFKNLNKLEILFETPLGRNLLSLNPKTDIALRDKAILILGVIHVSYEKVRSVKYDFYENGM